MTDNQQAAMREAFERIWLQVLNEDGERNDYEGCTWSLDQIHETDVEYVRADIVTRYEDALREARDALMHKAHNESRSFVVDQALTIITSLIGSSPERERPNDLTKLNT